LQTRSAVAGLEREFRAVVENAPAPAWIGYAVPAPPGDHQSCCCGSDHACTCCLEGNKDAVQGVSSTPIRLEGPQRIVVLFRVEQKQVGKIRMFSEDCALDAGGLPVHWLDGVRPADSVALLAGFATGAQERLRNSALVAIAMHAGPEALDRLIEMARRDPNSRVRGQALFWLAQKAGKKAAAAIGDAVVNDPETEVKKRAVFALSQLREDGVPMLIQVARSNANPEVRKQAIFWLGQSKDSRALGFFEEVLTGRGSKEARP
jgi:hypothetical protein